MEIHRGWNAATTNCNEMRNTEGNVELVGAPNKGN